MQRVLCKYKRVLCFFTQQSRKFSNKNIGSYSTLNPTFRYPRNLQKDRSHIDYNPKFHNPRRIYIIRHGEAWGNVDQSLFERIPNHMIPLTPVGVSQVST